VSGDLQEGGAVRGLPAESSRFKKGKIKRFLADWGGLVVVGLVLAALVVLFTVLISTGILQTGFDEYIPSAANAQRAKTFWDWMDLFLVPLALALSAGLFTWVTNRREQEAEERRARAERAAEDRQLQETRRIERERSREAALQAYLDRMTELIRDGLCASQPGDAKRSIARARTLTVLPQLDGKRRGLLLSFLFESELIKEEAVIDLAGANLGEADLYMANLSGAKLGEVDLSGANLRRARLYGAELCRTDLGEADLSGAYLSGADLSEATLSAADLGRATLSGASLNTARLYGADLREANLRDADLRDAYLFEADLRGAGLRGANLQGAYLREAKVTPEQLAQAHSLEGATLPDGTQHE